MIAKAVRLYNDSYVFPNRYRVLTEQLSEYLLSSTKVLDVGSSNGKLADTLIKANSKLQITGVDTHVLSPQYIHIDSYDGKHLPYQDNAFDTAMVIDVLHHDEEIEKVLIEVMRVTTRYILIKDHYFNNIFERAGLYFADFLGNAPYGIKLPYNYLNQTQWDHLFQKLKLKVVAKKKFRYSPTDITKNVIYFLEKTTGTI